MNKCLPIAITFGLFAFEFIFPFPATTLPCKPDTTSTYQNGSVQRCIVTQSLYISTGVFSFACQRDQYVNFDAQARLTSCVLATAFEVQQRGSTWSCRPNKPVQVSYSKEGTQSVNCR